MEALRKILLFYSIECREPMGLESGKLLDTSFKATSWFSDYFPYDARLNAKRDNEDMAWCTYKKASLTVSQ